VRHSLQKHIGTVQVDLDGTWVVASRFGVQLPISKDPIFESGFSNCLELLARTGLRATFFVVARDLAVPWKRRLITRAFDHGHELANHTMNHFGNLNSCDTSTKIREIEEAERAIQAITGSQPRGFKSPGYQMDQTILACLVRRGYGYDSSVIPSYVLPLIRLVEMALARRRTPPYGSFADAVKPSQPYVMSLKWGTTNEFRLTEIPTSVVPFLRLPFHGSFVSNLGRSYFHTCFKLFSSASPFLNFVLHLKDLAPASIAGVPLYHTRSGNLLLFEDILKHMQAKYRLQRTIDFQKYFLRSLA